MRMGDAYIIVYSVTDKSSFEKASELRIQLRRARQSENIPIILVGNKSDLVRSREVSVDGKISPSFCFILKMADRNLLCRLCLEMFWIKYFCLLSFEEQPGGIAIMTRSFHPSGNGVNAHLHVRLCFPVSLEGSACAVVFDCKFIETSASLHHNVRDLFEGIVRQIRLRKDSKEENARRMANCKRRESISKKAKRFLGRMVARKNKKMAFRQKSKSCHDLSVL